MPRFGFDHDALPLAPDPAIFLPPPVTEANFTGTAGNDTFTGTNGIDTFDLSQGGNDTASGLGGADTFDMGAALNTADKIDGGGGLDTMNLAGDYSSGVTFNATTMVGVETLSLAGGFSYKLTTNDATVASGARLTVDASALASGDVLTFNGGAETDGRFSITGGAGNDVITAGAGDDVVAGGDGNDKISLAAGGNDTANGGNGNDSFLMGGAATQDDRINGGAGNDTIVLNGDYLSYYSLQNVTNVEKLALTGGHHYFVSLADSTVAAGRTLTVDATALGNGDGSVFDAGQETDGYLHYEGGQGADILFYGGNFVAADHIDGGGGSQDNLVLSGDYSGTHALALNADSIVNIENLDLENPYNFNIRSDDGTVAAGQTLYVEVSQSDAAHYVIFNGAAETDGMFDFIPGSGNDKLTGGAQADTFTMTNGGDDTVSGGGGNDNFYFDKTFTAADSVDGGSGNDTLVLQGEYTGSHAVVMGADTLTNVETIELSAGFNYDLTTNDATVASGQRLVVDGTALKYGNTLIFDGSAETDGTFLLRGGAGNDFLVGGAGADNLEGRGGADMLEGGAGANVFFYGTVADSTGPFYDTIVDFDAGKDVFAVPSVPVTGVVSTITSGTLSQATFDSDLAAAVNSTFLQPHQCALFTPDSGDLSGETFLVIDENGDPGYQSGGDLVFHLMNASNVGTITTANFQSIVG
ncbi:MAG TPA: calcium-binding protein [Rhizomicrobium sp.]|nr:calcium-binding protein [Rhizomicrobium sp.]